MRTKHTFKTWAGGIALAAALASGLGPVAPVMAMDDAKIKKLDETAVKAITFLRTKQLANGAWSPDLGPAITALVVRAMIEQGVKRDDPAVEKGVAFILTFVKPDGGIHDGKVENYTTSICLSALALVNDKPGVAAAIKGGQDYLRKLQWDGQTAPDGKVIDKNHPFYGGAGYGRHGRPDLSNTQIMIEGLHDSGLDCKDPAYQRALVFIERCQGTATNTAPYKDRLEMDGGFIYATSLNKDKIGVPESAAGEYTVDVPEKGQVSKLRNYGSMTYGGFKSYLYAQLDRKDPRVVDAYKWITSHYTLEGNPGMVDDPKTPADERMQGYFYYVMAFSRAFQAWGEKEIKLADGKKADWGADLVDKLAAIQKPDGSWVNASDRWAEGDPVLVTAYSVIALSQARK